MTPSRPEPESIRPQDVVQRIIAAKTAVGGQVVQAAATPPRQTMLQSPSRHRS